MEETHIAGAMTRIERQQLLIRELERDGHAELLRAAYDLLREMRNHLAEIKSHLTKENSGSARPNGVRRR